MRRSQAFKDYVLKREHIRGNPYNFNRVEDIRDYTRGYGDPKYEFYEAEYGDSAWTYEALFEFVGEVCTITPAEVVHSKVAKALFLENL
jgi:hypothetical protein